MVDSLIITWPTGLVQSQSGLYVNRDIEVTGEGTIPTSTEDPEIPSAFALYQNVPNPFNPSTSIIFDLPSAIHVTLDVYNVKGEKIVRLVDRRMTPGRKEIVWNAQSGRGISVTSGIYFYRLIAGEFTETRKMVLLK